MRRRLVDFDPSCQREINVPAISPEKTWLQGLEPDNQLSGAILDRFIFVKASLKCSNVKGTAFSKLSPRKACILARWHIDSSSAPENPSVSADTLCANSSRLTLLSRMTSLRCMLSISLLWVSSGNGT